MSNWNLRSGRIPSEYRIKFRVCSKCSIVFLPDGWNKKCNDNIGLVKEK